MIIKVSNSFINFLKEKNKKWQKQNKKSPLGTKLLFFLQVQRVSLAQPKLTILRCLATRASVKATVMIENHVSFSNSLHAYSLEQQQGRH